MRYSYVIVLGGAPHNGEVKLKLSRGTLSLVCRIRVTPPVAELLPLVVRREVCDRFDLCWWLGRLGKGEQQEEGGATDPKK